MVCAHVLRSAGSEETKVCSEFRATVTPKQALSALLNAYPEYYRGRAVSRVLHFIVEPLFSRERVQLCIYAESSDFYRSSYNPAPKLSSPFLLLYCLPSLPSLVLPPSPPSRCGSAFVRKQMAVSAYRSLSLSGFDQSTSMAMEGDMDIDMDIDLGPVTDLEAFQLVRLPNASNGLMDGNRCSDRNRSNISRLSV